MQGKEKIWYFCTKLTGKRKAKDRTAARRNRKANCQHWQPNNGISQRARKVRRGA